MRQYGYRQPPPGYQRKNKVVAFALFLLLGELGLGNFYLGQNVRGVIKIICLFFILLTIMTKVSTYLLGLLVLWKFIELCLVIMGAGSYGRDGNGVALD